MRVSSGSGVSAAVTDSMEVPSGRSWSKYAPISVSASGDNTVVAAVAGKRIRVLSYLLIANAAVVATWKSSAAGAISGPISLAANGGASCALNTMGWLQTAVGEGLVLNLGAAVSVGSHLQYIEV